MAYVHRIPVRFDDVDYARIVYFPRLFGYCHQAFEDFFAKEAGTPYSVMLQQRKVGFPSVHAEADFKSPLRFGDVCRVVMETVKMGKSALTNAYRLYLGETDTLCAEVEIVTVALNLDTFVTVDVPEDVRMAFLNHLSGYTSA
ncbi:MAG: acyl-CoA thioesterase [Myxococcaceae bacterium]